MKKILLSVVFMTVCLCSFAQGQEKKANKIQYYHEAGISALYAPNDVDLIDPLNDYTSVPFNNLFGVCLHELHGIKFNPHLILSAEFDVYFRYSIADKVHSLYPCDMFGFGFLMGLDFKYIMLKKYNWSPYLEISLTPLGFATATTRGYPVQHPNPIGTRTELYGVNHTGEYSVFAGANYKVKERQSLNISVGYRILSETFMLRVGYQFR